MTTDMEQRPIALSHHVRKRIAERFGVTDHDQQTRYVRMLYAESEIVGPSMEAGCVVRRHAEAILLSNDHIRLATGSVGVLIVSIFPPDWRVQRGNNGLYHLIDPALTLSERMSR